jgi:hypothetical protein
MLYTYYLRPCKYMRVIATYQRAIPVLPPGDVSLPLALMGIPLLFLGSLRRTVSSVMGLLQRYIFVGGVNLDHITIF